MQVTCKIADFFFFSYSGFIMTLMAWSLTTCCWLIKIYAPFFPFCICKTLHNNFTHHVHIAMKKFWIGTTLIQHSSKLVKSVNDLWPNHPKLPLDAISDAHKLSCITMQINLMNNGRFMGSSWVIGVISTSTLFDGTSHKFEAQKPSKFFKLVPCKHFCKLGGSRSYFTTKSLQMIFFRTLPYCCYF